MPTDDEDLAMAVADMLATGQGGIDWGGLPLAAELFGIADVEMLMHRLRVIKRHDSFKER